MDKKTVSEAIDQIFGFAWDWDVFSQAVSFTTKCLQQAPPEDLDLWYLHLQEWVLSMARATGIPKEAFQEFYQVVLKDPNIVHAVLIPAFQYGFGFGVLLEKAKGSRLQK